MAYEKKFRAGRWFAILVVDFSRPWGCRMHGGRIARFAWCWIQAESRTGFSFGRLLVLGPFGLMVSKITIIREEA